MEEFTMLQSMFNLLNSNNPKKQSVIEALPIILNDYDIYGESDVYNLVKTSTHNLCFQVFNSSFEISAQQERDVSLNNIKSLLVYFIDIITKHSNTDIIQLFEKFTELTNKVDFIHCSLEQFKNIKFCIHKLYISSGENVNNCTHLDYLRKALINVLNEPCLNRQKLDSVIMFLHNIISIHNIPTFWQSIKPMIEMYPDRIVSILFDMQCLFFDPLCVHVILNDDDFWSLLCSLLTCANNFIRNYNHVILKLSCSQLSNENVNFCTNESREKCIKVWNDYVIVMETLENTQQHLTLPILSTAKKLALLKSNNDCDYKLPLKWITAMHNKMSKHSSKYVVLTSIDIITNMSIKSLKVNEQIIKSFVDSLNNVFLYKMSSELCVNQPKLEIILSLWFNELMITYDGHRVFGIFLSYVSTIKWSIVPLIFLTKSFTNISSNPPLGFNIIDHVLKIKFAVEKIPNSHLKTIVLRFLFIFTSKFFVNIDTQFCCELFDCILVDHKNKESWDFIMKSIQKINDLDLVDKELTLCLNKKYKMYTTSIGLLIASNIFFDDPDCLEKLNVMCSNTLDLSELLDFLDCLLEIESQYDIDLTPLSEILDRHVWRLTTNWIEKFLYNLEEGSCENPVIYSFLDKVLSSNRIINTSRMMNIWLLKCKSIIEEHLGNYTVLAIYSWIGKYALSYSTEIILKNNWLSTTERYINLGFFSLKSQGFYQLKKPGIHQIHQLDIINTFFQHSIVSEKQMFDIFDWLTKKTLERHDNYWNIYFSTVKTFFYKFPLGMNSEKIIQFIKNCWEFLVDCRVSCFPNSIKSFIEMAFHYHMLSEDKYVKFIENEIMENLLTEKYRDKFSVCFSLLLLKFFNEDQPNVINILDFNVMSKFFAKCLLFSIDRYGAHKIEWDTFEYVRTLHDYPLINDISTECVPDDRCLRFNSLKYLYNLNSNKWWKNVLNIVIQNESLSQDRKFFHNSKAHHLKQRVVQVLLIIACDKQHQLLLFDENIYKWSLSSLKEVPHILSVAYQLIWLLVLIYHKSSKLLNFWNDFKKTQENPNYLCSFISIIYHLQKIQNSDQFKIEAIHNLLPLCFSNGYKVRLYAQITICRLLPNNNEESEHSLLCETIENIIAQNKQTKKYENPFDDFFYQEIDMINSLSLKNVCVEVPRLLNIVYEDRFPIKWLDYFSAAMTCNKNYDLSHCSVSSFVEKNTQSVLSNEIITLDDSQNAQRKYIPSQHQDKHTINSALIVVASLIDKVTNLGGLARTCQVFGASTLVVDSLSCVEKREFTALSMTAEKHQYIIEVRIKNLKSYLHQKKNEGYTIVAAEQTVDSVKLHDIELPFKCVLILGNETSGIPHDLLSAMDTCIEIEQLGIVRSLNVHVAGSLFIWEYTKQHCLKVSN